MALGVRLGIEIGPRVIRAVRLCGLFQPRADAMEIEWDGESLDDAVSALADRFGSGARVAVAIDVAALFVKHLELPPIPLAERHRMILLDPERYFPVRGQPLTVSVREGPAGRDLVFAVSEALLDRWTSALERLGSVESVEPGPAALARGAAHGGLADGTLVIVDDHTRCAAIVAVTGGRPVTVRKIRGGVTDAANALAAMGTGAPRPLHLAPWSESAARAVADRLGVTPVGPLPSVMGLTPAFATACGAALGTGDAPQPDFAPPTLVARLRRRHNRRVAVAAATFAAAFAFFVASLDQRRARTLAAIEREIALRQPHADSVLALREQLDALETEADALAEVAAARMNPLAVMLAVTRYLPPDAHLRSIRGTGREWQMEGYARDAAQVIPALEGSPEFEDVRFRTATSRVRIGESPYDDFSLALRVASTP